MGGVEEFDAYVAGRGLALTRFAYLLCGDRHLAEDIVQEVLGRMCRRWARVVAGGSPEPYVRAAIVRQAISWRRRRSSSERPMAQVGEVDTRVTVRAYDARGRLLASKVDFDPMLVPTGTPTSTGTGHR